MAQNNRSFVHQRVLGVIKLLDISQGSVERCGGSGIFNDHTLLQIYSTDSEGEIILKIVQHLEKLRATVDWHFLIHSSSGCVFCAILYAIIYNFIRQLC